jgi:hypothetical protein
LRGVTIVFARLFFRTSAMSGGIYAVVI